MEIKIHDNIIHYDVVHPQGSTNLLILHGWRHNGAMWHQVAKQLPDSIRSYCIDLPGFGHSPLGNISTLSDYAETIREFAAKLNLKPYSLLGHSFGGQIAVKVAGYADVTSLILVAPAITRERHTLSKNWYQLLGVLAKSKRFLPSSWTYDLSSGSNYSEASPELKSVFQQVIHQDVILDLTQIQVPTLCIWGEHDREILGDAKTIVNQFPQGRLKVIYDAGHNLHLEKPTELARLIERYV